MSILDKFKYYDVNETISKVPNAKYYVIFGERSNGKTYSLLKYALKRYKEHGKQFAYVRRFNEDIRSKWMSQLFAPHVKNRELEKLFGDDWDSIMYSMGSFRLRKSGVKKKDDIIDTKPIGFCFDLNGMEHSKGNGFPDVDTIIFDEFMSRQGYLPNEFTLFTNVLSTIIRLRTDTKVFMLGNTVNKYCPYFKEMGLTHVAEQKQGTIDTYHYGDSDLIVACEYCSSSKARGGKPSDVYFGFDSPQLEMVKNGVWETASYPRLTFEVKPKEIVAKFFVEFNGEVLQGEIINHDNNPLLFFHRRNRAIRGDHGEILKQYRNNIIFTDKPGDSPYEFMGLAHRRDKLSLTIIQLMEQNRTFYSANWIGEIWRNYVIWSGQLMTLYRL